MASEYCDRDHSGEIPKGLFDGLPKSQARDWRHKCAACAYVKGRQDAETALRARIAELEAQLRSGG